MSRSPLPFVSLVALGLAVAATDAHAIPPRHDGPLPAPLAPTGETSDGVVTLMAPSSVQVLIRGGTFTMGSDGVEVAAALSLCTCERTRQEPARETCDLGPEECREEWFGAETPAHQVWLSDYWIDRREVTVARYRACVDAGACAPPPFTEGGERFNRPDYPVSLVTWMDASRFCAWSGGRLPTEAEWERAARGPNHKAAPSLPGAQVADDERLPKGRRFPWGDVYNPFIANHGTYPAASDEVGWLDPRDGYLELAPVGSFLAGRTSEGLDDLAGNVEEWVSDWFGEYPSADVVNPTGPDNGDRRAVRGGSYVKGRVWMRGAARDRLSPGDRLPWVGFRCARSIGGSGART